MTKLRNRDSWIRRWYKIGNQRLRASPVLSSNHDSIGDLFNGAKGNFNFPNVNSKTTDLYQEVLATNVDQATVRSPQSDVAG